MGWSRSSTFRTIHTIEGDFGVPRRRCAGAAHVGEHLLSSLRDGELAVTENGTSALLWIVDVVRGLLGIIERSGADASILVA